MKFHVSEKSDDNQKGKKYDFTYIAEIEGSD